MSGVLPVVSGKQAVAALGRIGYEPERMRGDHQILKHHGKLERPSAYRTVAVPMHRELARGTLAGILRRVGLSPDEFRALL